MDRKTFIKHSALGLGALATGPSMLKATNVRLKKSTYDQLAEQVGFNHLPNSTDIMTTPDSTMKMILHKADTRGHADHGWLNSHHSFSFANYYNPERMHFGVLRVLNDDIVAPGRGFGTHPHDNMEIFSYVLRGSLAHEDSMGNRKTLRPGEIQVMSAGSGVTHSEFNPSADEPVELLQIWIQPNRRNLEPSYTEWAPTAEQAAASKTLLISPDGREHSARIHQDAFVYRIALEQGERVTHDLVAGRGAWLQVIRGGVVFGCVALGTGDAGSTEQAGTLEIRATAPAEALLFDLR